MDQHGRKQAGVPSLGLSAIGLALLALASSPPGMLFAAVVLGLGNGMSNGWIQTVGADLAPPGARPQFLGYWNLLMGLGAAVGPLWVGWIAEIASASASCWATALIAAAGSLWYALACDDSRPTPKERAPAKAFERRPSVEAVLALQQRTSTVHGSGLHTKGSPTALL